MDTITLNNLLNTTNSNLGDIVNELHKIPEEELIIYLKDNDCLNKFYIDEKFNKKKIILHYVSKYSREVDSNNKLLQILINAGANLDLQDNWGWTALILAARYSNTTSTEETVRMLIRAGANLDLQSMYGWTALTHAARWSNIYSTEETVRMLIRAGANLDLQINDGIYTWETALICAVSYSKTDSTEETVRMLIGAGANLDLQTNDGYTALILAARYSNTTSTEETVRMLIRAGANLDLQTTNRYNNGWTALMFAARFSNTDSTEETVRMLIGAGANLDLQHNNGLTALMFAVYVSYKTSSYLLYNGSNPFIHNYNSEGNKEPEWSPLMFSTWYIKLDKSNKKINEMLKIINVLISFGCDINYKTTNDKSLHTCLKKQLKDDDKLYKQIKHHVHTIDKYNKMSLKNVCTRYIRAKSYFKFDRYRF